MSKTIDLDEAKSAVRNIIDDIGISLNYSLDRGEVLSTKTVLRVIHAGYDEVMVKLDNLAKAQ